MQLLLNAKPGNQNLWTYKNAKNTPPQQTKACNFSRYKITQWKESAQQKLSYPMLNQVVTMVNVKWNCIKESPKQLPKNVTQVTKVLFLWIYTKT